MSAALRRGAQVGQQGTKAIGKAAATAAKATQQQLRNFNPWITENPRNLWADQNAKHRDMGMKGPYGFHGAAEPLYGTDETWSERSTHAGGTATLPAMRPIMVLGDGGHTRKMASTPSGRGFGGRTGAGHGSYSINKATGEEHNYEAFQPPIRAIAEAKWGGVGDRVDLLGDRIDDRVPDPLAPAGAYDVKDKMAKATHGPFKGFIQTPFEFPGVSIADEEPIFGKYGYKPLPKASQAHYTRREGILTSVFCTASKATRHMGMRKMVLPPPSKVVAIIGPSGFVGSRIARRFVEDPTIQEVRLCTRFPDDIPPDLQRVIDINPDKVTLEETNVLDRASLNRAFVGVDSVIYAVDCTNQDFYNMHFEVYVRGGGNVAFTARIINALRMLYISGLNAQFNHDSDYSGERARGEDVVKAEHFFYNVIRQGQVYGHGYRFRGPGKIWYPTVYPDTRLSPVWVNDIAEASFRLFQNPESVRRDLDLGGPKAMTHMQFAVERAQIYGNPKPFPLPHWCCGFSAFMAEHTFGNPWISQDMVLDYEMDQLPRTKAMNPHIWTWEDLGITPHTMEEAKMFEDKDNFWGPNVA